MSVCVGQRSHVPCGCRAILSEKDPRAEIWMAVFGCLEFPLQNPIPLMARATGENAERFLKGDWEALSLDQQVQLCQEMKKKFSG